MAYSEQIKQRAIELSKVEKSAGAVRRKLDREFPNEHRLPDERTIRRWLKEEPSIPIDQVHEKRTPSISENWKEHNEQLAAIATRLLSNGLENVSPVGWTTDETQKGKYLIPNQNATSLQYDLISKEQLAEQLNQNMDEILRDKDWFFRRRFMPHLKSELPEELQTIPLFDLIIEKQPYQLIVVFRELLERKKFRGTCPVCKDW